MTSASSFETHAEMIEDRKGWLTDTFTLRSVITKLGYQRASIEDGGSLIVTLNHLVKWFIRSDSFSGSYVPEENLAAVCTTSVLRKRMYVLGVTVDEFGRCSTSIVS